MILIEELEKSGELFLPRDIFLSIVETYAKNPERFKIKEL